MVTLILTAKEERNYCISDETLQLFCLEERIGRVGKQKAYFNYIRPIIVQNKKLRMSLFPAYGNPRETLSTTAKTENLPPKSATTLSSSLPKHLDNADWKNNQSYKNATILERATDSPPTKRSHYTDSDSSDSASAEEIQNTEALTPAVWPGLEFNGKDEFFVDKKSNSIYREWISLPRLTRPNYKVTKRFRKKSGDWRPKRRRGKEDSLSSKRSSQSLKDSLERQFSAIEIENAFMKIRDLKVLVTTEGKSDVDTWLELNKLLDLNLEKLTHFAKSEQQLRYLEMALQVHGNNEQLLQCYINTANATYPAIQVATLIERMLETNPFNYSLWTALIMATQGTMARCNVPDVLRIYERSMQRMHLGHSERGFKSSKIIDSVDTDGHMLRLFHNCVLFLRQSSNCNQMFALLKLGLELNVPGLQFDCFDAQASDEEPLVEYEELVLQSGLPMPQIWTRIERLRQAYHFLPYPQRQYISDDNSFGGLDPQRCVYSSDVCQLMYPLKSEGNCLHLLLLALQLTKMPFIRTNGLAQRLCAKINQIGDSDAIEMLMAGMGDRLSYAIPLEREQGFATALMELAKEMCVCPTFMPHTIGHELYAKMISELLLKSAQAFADDEMKRRIFIILWFRFERIRLNLQKLSGKLTPKYIKDARQRMRQLLRQEANRTSARFYAEMAMFEFETMSPKDNIESVFRIFKNIIASHAESNTNLENEDLLSVYMIYAEMLICRNQSEQSLHMLTCIAIKQHATLSIESGLEQRQYALIEGEELMMKEFRDFLQQPHEMELEEYFVSHKWLILLRARCLLLCLLGKTKEADNLLQKLLENHLKMNNYFHERKSYIREQIQELRLIIMELSGCILDNKGVTISSGLNGQLIPMLKESLMEFPCNHYLLSRVATLSTLPWFRLRGIFTETSAGILALLHMIIAARCRLIIPSDASNIIHEDQSMQKLQHDYMESIFRHRILHLFQTFLPANPHRSDTQAQQYMILRRNSLYWRCYLHCLSDKLTSFASSHRCLLSALDECPWDKALYMDGTVYVPQEFDHLQDVMTEKGLRIYALSDELDVLRTGL